MDTIAIGEAGKRACYRVPDLQNMVGNRFEENEQNPERGDENQKIIEFSFHLQVVAHLPQTQKGKRPGHQWQYIHPENLQEIKFVSIEIPREMNPSDGDQGGKKLMGQGIEPPGQHQIPENK